MVRIAREAGTSRAAPRPATARPTTRVGTSGASPHTTVPSVNSAIPSTKMRRRPYRSQSCSGCEKQARVDEVVDINDPLQLSHAGLQIRADRLSRKIDDRRVNLRDQHAERHGEKN